MSGPRIRQRIARILRRAGAVALGVMLAAVTLAGILFAGLAGAAAETAAAEPGESGAVSHAAAEWPADGESGLAPADRIAVAVVLGRSGTDAADALAPYEVFARSPRFAVYTVAATAAPVPLNGGLRVVPAFTFAQVASGAAPRPDVVVVPAVNDPGGASEEALRAWITTEAADGAQIFVVCAGARAVAATGLLDGHRATSHWSRIGQLREGHPEVEWVTGQRWVQDGPLTTSAGVTSGIPAALRLVQQLAGDAEAERVGAELAYPGWSLSGSTAIPEERFEATDLGVGLNAALPWFRPVAGVALADGIGEIDAVGPFEVASYSGSATAVPLAHADRVTTAHGVVVLASTPANAPRLDRLLVPGAADVDRPVTEVERWADAGGIPITRLRSGDGGISAALTDLAEHSGDGIAQSTAKLIEYPRTGNPALSVEPRTAALLAAAVILAVCAGAMPFAVIRAVRARRATRRS